ncbi:MAG: glycosyltransferase [Caldilineales bacterium]|nr:glycosyltransferase [Caldilineales bacterium]MDW8318052.1 glycosyltransferase [Anaerolineae bacterium]
MRIVAFSINPLYPDQVMGGAPKHLQQIVAHLGSLGHQVTVLCSGDPAVDVPFQWGENVQVLPVLRFKLPFPQPYATPAYHLAAAIHEVASHLAQADRFYMHDGEFLFPYVYQSVPTVISLRDSVYPETQLGAFLFQGDVLITISEHSRQYYLHTAGRFLPDLAERMVVIPNGLDWNTFRPTPPAEILQIVPVDPQRDVVVLHPHRPEPSKGLPQTIQVADLLVKRYGLRNLKVLTPRWLEAGLSPEVREFVEAMRREIYCRGLTEYFVFHDWVPQRLMPQYYSLAAVTLALGSFVEAFGNAVYESLGCGTPAVVARVGAHRELLPDHLVDKVHFGDVETAAALAADIIAAGRRTSPETMAYLHQHYSRDRQVAAYAATILNARRRGPIAYRFPALNGATRFGLAPWCYEWSGGYYHDFRAEHCRIEPLRNLFRRYGSAWTAEQAEAAGVSPEMLADWLREGYVVPLLSET